MAKTVSITPLRQHENKAPCRHVPKKNNKRESSDKEDRKKREPEEKFGHGGERRSKVGGGLPWYTHSGQRDYLDGEDGGLGGAGLAKPDDAQHDPNAGAHQDAV